MRTLRNLWCRLMHDHRYQLTVALLDIAAESGNLVWRDRVYQVTPK